MSASTQRLLVRIGRWPRRIAALACLLLAAGSTLRPAARPAAAPARQGISGSLHRGEVAVPVPIGSAVHDVHRGDLVGVLAGPTDTDTGPAVVVADGLRVLSVAGGTGSGLAADEAVTLVVATDRTRALRLARYSGRPFVLIVDDVP